MTCGTDDTEPLLNDPRVKELLANIDSLRKGYTRVQEKYLTTFDELEKLQEKYDTLQQASEPFIHHGAKLVSQSTDGKAYMAIEVLIEDILNLRKVLKGS